MNVEMDFSRSKVQPLHGGALVFTAMGGGIVTRLEKELGYSNLNSCNLFFFELTSRAFNLCEEKRRGLH
jgi:hypothetical protein